VHDPDLEELLESTHPNYKGILRGAYNFAFKKGAGMFGKAPNGGGSSSSATIIDAAAGTDCCAPELSHSSCQASTDMQHAAAQTIPVIVIASGDAAESVEGAARALATATALAKQASLPDIPYLKKRSSTYTHLDTYGSSSSSSSPRSSFGGTRDEPEAPKLNKTEPAGSAASKPSTRPRKASSRSLGSSSTMYGLVLGFLVGTVLAILWTLAVTLPPGKLQHRAGPRMIHHNQPDTPTSYISQAAIRASLSTAGSFLQRQTASLSSWDWLQHPGLLSAANGAWHVSNAAANIVRHAAAAAAAKSVPLLRLYPSTSAASGSPEMGSVLGQIQQELAVWQAAVQAAHAAGPTAQQAQQQLQMAQSLLHLLQRATAEAKTHALSVSPAASTAQRPSASPAALSAPATGFNATLKCTDKAAPAVSDATCPAASLYGSRPGVTPAVCGSSLAITHTALRSASSVGEGDGLPREVCPAVSAAQGANATAAPAAPSWTDPGYGVCPAAFSSIASPSNSTAEGAAKVVTVHTSQCHLPLLPVAVCSSQPRPSDITCSAQGSMEVVSFLQQLVEAAAAAARLEPLVCLNNSTTSLEHMLQQVAAAAKAAAAATAAAIRKPVAAMPQGSVAAAAADSAPGASRHCECVCVDVVTTAPMAGPTELDRPATVLGKKVKQVLGYLQQTFSPEALELMLVSQGKS